MLDLTVKNALGRVFFLLLVAASFASMAMAQAVISQPNNLPKPSPSPFVQKTGISTPTTNPTKNVPDLTNPTPDISVSGMAGILVETQNGTLVADSSPDVPFNPASNVKLLTAYAALKKLEKGPNFRFQTNVFTDGIYNKETGTIEGNLYIVGKDPSFNNENAVVIADSLNKIGVRSINGNLIVSPAFTMNFNESSERSGSMLYNALDTARRSPTVLNDWKMHLMAGGKYTVVNQGVPSISVAGKLSVDIPPTNSQLLVQHESAPLKDILKVLLSYSNNFMAERVGDAIGGPTEVERTIYQTVGVAPGELRLASCSGLGLNRVTPRAMMRVLRALLLELSKYKLTAADIMPVAGIDEGTLRRRFTEGDSVGSVIAKTGTLPNTDSGVSSLVGIMATKSGDFMYFVIFNQRGNVNRFRSFQDSFVLKMQNMKGGPTRFQYLAKTFPTLLANTKVNIPSNRPRIAQ